MKYREQKAMRSGDWKYLSLEGSEFLFNLEQDVRERANLARRDPQRLAAMRVRYSQWEASMPPIPRDAAVSLVHDKTTTLAAP
jgi:arylsulfatase A-like enzyme